MSSANIYTFDVTLSGRSLRYATGDIMPQRYSIMDTNLLSSSNKE